MLGVCQLKLQGGHNFTLLLGPRTLFGHFLLKGFGLVLHHLAVERNGLNLIVKFIEIRVDFGDTCQQLCPGCFRLGKAVADVI